MKSLQSVVWKSALAACLLGLLMWAAAGSTMAQTPAQTPAQSAAQPAATASEDQVNTVAKQLWCPLCSNVRLDSCELKACAQMKDVIAQKLGQGEDVQSIKNYFVAQYGPQVLGEPPFEGFNWLAWILPVLAVIVGGLIIWLWARRMVRPQPASAASSAPGSEASGDPYAEKLEKELKHYD